MTILIVNTSPHFESLYLVTYVWCKLHVQSPRRTRYVATGVPVLPRPTKTTKAIPGAYMALAEKNGSQVGSSICFHGLVYSRAAAANAQKLFKIVSQFSLRLYKNDRVYHETRLKKWTEVIKSKFYQCYLLVHIDMTFLLLLFVVIELAVLLPPVPGPHT